MEWGNQQANALQLIEAWVSTRNGRDKQTFYLAGYAGTGKTTIAKTVAEMIDGPVQFAAYTGKAASVMREKGCHSAQTLHSLVYTVDSFVDEEELDLREELAECVDPKERHIIAGQLRRVVARANKTRWIVNHTGPLSSAHLLILDECSMVDQKLGADILSFGKPVLVLGDPMQLPPPTGTGFFTNRTPDAILTDVHRQAADNPIIRLATLAREGRPIPKGTFTSEYGVTRVGANRAWLEEGHDVILTGKNRTRRRLNLWQRGVLHGTKLPLRPMKGDTVIVLRNDSELGVFNGVLGSMVSDSVVTSNGDFVGDMLYESRTLADLTIMPDPFSAYADLDGPDIPIPYNRNKLPMDFGYALTVHKAQGSEWGRVCLVDDGFAKWSNNQDRERWLYTAITRAAHELTIYTGAI